jgi:flagellar biosynthesis protein FliQ
MYQLTLLSVLYLVTPSIIFLSLWIRIEIAIPAVVALLVALSVALVQARKTITASSAYPRVTGSMWVCAAAYSLVICLISEFGVSPYQSYDHMIHNYKYHLLTTQPMPLRDSKYGVDVCYYLGFYVVPGMLGKLVGLGYAKYISFAWIWGGLFLAFVWIEIVLLKRGIEWRFIRSGIWVLLMMVAAFVNGVLPLYQYLTADPHVFNNAIQLQGKFVLNQVPVFTRSLSESVQHTIPSVLGTAMLLASLPERRLLFVSSLVVFATLFWSPFATIGLFLFVLVAVIRELRNEPKGRFAVGIVGFNGVLFMAFAPIILFLLSSDSTDMSSNRFIWEAGVKEWWFYYALYGFSFWWIWFFLIGKDIFRFDKEALLVSCVLFSVLGMVQMGYYNDLNIRASIPSMFVLGLSILFVVLHPARTLSKTRYGVLLVFLGVNSLSVGKFFYERFFTLTVGEAKNSIESPANVYGDNFYDFLENAYQDNGSEVVKQYSLRRGSVFEVYLLRKEG